MHRRVSYFTTENTEMEWEEDTSGRTEPPFLFRSGSVASVLSVVKRLASVC
jgi:hypothetical protein